MYTIQQQCVLDSTSTPATSSDQPLNASHCLSAAAHYHQQKGHLAGRRDGT